MRKPFLLLLTLFPLPLSAQAEPGRTLEIPLKFLKAGTGKSPRRRVFLPSGVRFLSKSFEKPQGEWRLPKFHTARPVYSFLTLAGKKHLLVLDTKAPRSAFYDRLYFDADGDGDLTDETPTDARTSPRSRTPFSNFPPIDVEMEIPGGKAPYCFQVMAYKTVTFRRTGTKGEPLQELRKVILYARTACAYRGEFRLNGKTYRVLLADSNVDGIFGSPDEVPVGRGRKAQDLIYLAEGKPLSYRDGMTAQGTLGIGAGIFRISFDQARARLLFTPLSESPARLRLTMAVSKLVLLPGKGGKGILWFDPPEEIALPPGTYRLGSYQATRKDDGGNEWVLQAKASKNTPLVEVKPGRKGAVLRFGEPYTPKIRVVARFPRVAKKKSVTARLAFTLVGAGGERVTDLRSMTYKKSKIPRSRKNRYRPLEPSYEIRELPSLSPAAKGSFHYG